MLVTCRNMSQLWYHPYKTLHESSLWDRGVQYLVQMFIPTTSVSHAAGRSNNDYFLHFLSVGSVLIRIRTAAPSLTFYSCFALHVMGFISLVVDTLARLLCVVYRTLALGWLTFSRLLVGAVVQLGSWLGAGTWSRFTAGNLLLLVIILFGIILLWGKYLSVIETTYLKFLKLTSVYHPMYVVHLC